MRQLILASASPRRRELLTLAGFSFQVRAADVDETARPNEDAVALAIRLAQAKAGAAPPAEEVVLGADTVVLAPNGEILGKPADSSDAARMLALLAGATHQVITGVAIRDPARDEIAAELTWVTMHTLSAAEIDAYVATGEPMGKAGAYAIQGRATRFIPRIHGDYTNVVGLPLALVTDMLAPFQVFPH